MERYKTKNHGCWRGVGEGSCADRRTSPGDPFLCSGQPLLIGKVAVEARQVCQCLLAAEPPQRIRCPILAVAQTANGTRAAHERAQSRCAGG